MQELFIKAAEANGVVGAAIATIKNGSVEIVCFGKKSVYSKQPIAEDTLFEIGSITKVFTTLLLADLLEKGKLNLDDSLSCFLPSSVKIPCFQGDPIRLRHLATHTSGLPNLPTNLKAKNLTNPFKNYSVEKLYQFLESFSLPRAPGERFEYSNLGMGLLGHLLSLSQGKSYHKLLSQNILQNLSLFDTGCKRWFRSCTQGHFLGRPTPHWKVTEAFQGAGGLFSNIKDMAKFLVINLGAFTPSLMQKLELRACPELSRLSARCHQRFYPSGRSESVGLGWFISDVDGAEIVWHDGITAGSRAMIGFNLRNQKGIVILANAPLDWQQSFVFNWLVK